MLDRAVTQATQGSLKRHWHSWYIDRIPVCRSFKSGSMSAQPITPVQAASGSSSSSVQSDYQVRQLESQIKDWSSCPTTPPATKKAIVAKLQLQLDSIEKGLETHLKNAQTQKQADGQAGSSRNGSSPQTATPARRHALLFKVDTLA